MDVALLNVKVTHMSLFMHYPWVPPPISSIWVLNVNGWKTHMVVWYLRVLSPQKKWGSCPTGRVCRTSKVYCLEGQTLKVNLPPLSPGKCCWDTCIHRKTGKGWLTVLKEGLAGLFPQTNLQIGVNVRLQIPCGLKAHGSDPRCYFPQNKCKAWVILSTHTWSAA